MPCDYAFESVTTQAVADEDRGEVLAIGLIDGALQLCSEDIRRVMQALTQESEVEYISGECGVVTEFTPKDMTCDDLVSGHLVLFPNAAVWGGAKRRLVRHPSYFVWPESGLPRIGMFVQVLNCYDQHKFAAYLVK
jgi:hypothetical protein